MRKIVTGLLLVILLAGAWLTFMVAEAGGNSVARPARHPDLDYLKAVNRAGPRDPQLLFLLMGQFANANMHTEGIEYFSTVLKELSPNLSDPQKSLYLAAIALLRVGKADKVSLFRRVEWVKESIHLLEDAKRLSGGDIFIVRWIAGVVYAQLPDRFHQRETALAELTWCLENAGKAPGDGWLREVYYQVARLKQLAGETAKANEYLGLSGYPDFNKAITLTTPLAEDPATGHTFSSRRITEVVPGRLYALSGYEFTEYYFLVSHDGRELIAIDAGTRPDSARAAYEALRAYAPGLPELTTVLITHSHWDHIGGHQYFRSLGPKVKFYARTNYAEEIARDLNAPGYLIGRFFGKDFSLENIRSFRPDVTIDHQAELKIGGTRIDFIPIQGGETSDALFFYLPDDGVMFTGDFAMPYLGGPFIEEGNLDGLLDAIDVVASKNPSHLLHGHDPLNRIFASPATLVHLRPALLWLRDQVLAGIRQGTERAALQQANLIPPGLVDGDVTTHLPYLLMRENVINRIYDQNTGYWQADLEGLEYLSRADRGSILVDYLGISERQLAQATERMIADGNYELAASTLELTKDRFGASKSLDEARRLTYLKLMEKNQYFNPFKFIIYSAKINQQTPQMEAKK